MENKVALLLSKHCCPGNSPHYYSCASAVACWLVQCLALAHVVFQEVHSLFSYSSFSLFVFGFRCKH